LELYYIIHEKFIVYNSNINKFIDIDTI
jgi:hypothetical protein